VKIDTHQHYWAYAAEEFPWISPAMPALQKDCLPATVGPALQAAGVDAVVAVQARSDAAETGYLLGLAQSNPQIVAVVGWTDLCAPGVADTLDAYANQSLLKGFRHILQDEPNLSALVRSPAFNQGVKAVQQRALVYDVLVFDHQMSAVLDFCGRHNAHWLVLDHVGKPCLRDWHTKSEVPTRWLACMRALAAMPHVVCKLSGLVTESNWTSGHALQPQDSRVMLECFDRALELFGPNRILFGSDWPVCQLAAPYEVVHGLAQRWANTRLTHTEQNAFWSANAQRCYDLQLPPAA
jgi:L-fuconolactonase